MEIGAGDNYTALGHLGYNQPQLALINYNKPQQLTSITLINNCYYDVVW